VRSNRSEKMGRRNSRMKKKMAAGQAAIRTKGTNREWVMRSVEDPIDISFFWRTKELPGEELALKTKAGVAGFSRFENHELGARLAAYQYDSCS